MGQMVGRSWFGHSLLAAAFSLLLIAVISVRIGEAADTRISLTPDEQAWLDDHRVIRVANEDDWPPFDFSIDGQANGISIDYMNLIADRVLRRYREAYD